MAQEALYDWGAYSANTLVDPTLYNIRRERRCEFIGEGRRLDDLLRWRALDQVKGFQIHGAKITNTAAYDREDGTNNLNINGVEMTADGYIIPYRVGGGGNYKDGLFFTEAHYLDPIAVKHFQITANDGATVSTSPIYQNPGWPIEQGASADIK